MSIKKSTIILLILSILMMTSCSPERESNVTPPDIHDNTILRLEFELNTETFRAGTAFAIEMEDESLILTAYHLFGEAGGLEKEIPATDLPYVLKKVTFRDAYNDEFCGESEKVLKISDADTSSTDKDIAAFYYGEKMDANRLKLSSKLPKIGETVWLAAPTINDWETKLHKATVKSASNKRLIFEYEEEDIILNATSGAPILNASGEVVGLNIGGGKQYSKTIGVANPCTSIEKMIKKALGD